MVTSNANLIYGVLQNVGRSIHLDEIVEKVNETRTVRRVNVQELLSRMIRKNEVKQSGDYYQIGN